jgi:hypothetical protein
MAFFISLLCGPPVAFVLSKKWLQFNKPIFIFWFLSPKDLLGNLVFVWSFWNKFALVEKGNAFGKSFWGFCLVSLLLSIRIVGKLLGFFLFYTSFLLKDVVIK